MHRSHLGILSLALIAFGLAGGCRRPETAAADSARMDTPLAADSMSSAPAGGVPVADSAAAVPSDTAPGAVGTPADVTPARPARAPAARTPARPAASTPSAPASGGASAPASQPAAQEDTVRGIVAEVGSVPVTSIVVKPAGGRSVTILGALAREIGQAAGAEVWVSGHRTPEGLHAMRYAVRSVDGQPAIDGTLAADGDELVLVTGTGRHRIARPPQALRGKVGARVWLVGALDGAITSYGVLRDAP